MKKIISLIAVFTVFCLFMPIAMSAESADAFTLEEMKANFHEAEKEAARWFSSAYSLEGWTDENSNPTQEQLTAAGYTDEHDDCRNYWMVKDTADVAEVRGRLSKYFTSDVIDRLMTDNKKFRYFFECDGKLYLHAEAAQYPYDGGRYEFEIKSQNENKVVLHLTYYYVFLDDDYKLIGDFDYLYEKQTDGTWKFTTYEMPMGSNGACSSLYTTYVKNKNPQTGDGNMTVLIALCALSAAVTVFCKRKHA